MVKQTYVLGIGALLLLVIVAISGCTSSSEDQTNSTDPTSIKNSAENVTVYDLYNNSIPVGTSIRMKAQILQNSGTSIRVSGYDVDSYGYNDALDKDVLVTLENDNVTVYEDDIVWLYGIYEGPQSYTTVLGASRKVPSIIHAWIEPTGEKAK
jgi:hypothetical protein